MVQASDTGKRNNISQRRRFNSSGFRRVLIQGQLSPAGMIIIKVLAKDFAMPDDGVDYLGPVGDRWRELCGSADVAGKWADDLVSTLRFFWADPDWTPFS